MDVADYLLGVLALAVGILPWAWASRRLAQRLLPEGTAAVVALAAALIGVGGLIVVAELLGVAGLFSRWFFAVVSAVAAVAVGRIGHPYRPRSTSGLLARPNSVAGWITVGCVVICVVATTALLIGRDIAVMRSGPSDFDSLHYHLTQAAQMAQSHDLRHLHHVAASDMTVYYPFNSELLNAVSMFGPRPDLAVFIWNLLFGWLALLACWVIGERWSTGASAVAAGSAVIALPILGQASTGPGLNDFPSIAFALSAVAFLAIAGPTRASNPRRQWLAELCLAGAACGLAAGTKLNALPLVVMLAVGAVVLAARDRRVAVFALSAPALLTGGFWYIRDWLIVGSPVPDLNLTLGGHGLHKVPAPEVEPQAFSVAHYLGNADVIKHWFEPGLRSVWTELWPVVGLLLAAGVVIAIIGGPTWQRRWIGLGVVVAFVAYLVTPTSALGAEGMPTFFATNSRYLLPPLAIAMVLLATSPLLQRLTLALTVGLTALTLALLALSSLPVQIAYTYGLIVTVVIGVAALGVHHVRRHRPGGLANALLASVTAVSVVGCGAAVQHHYVHVRYAAATPLNQLFQSVSAQPAGRVGVVGFPLQYPFYGPDLDNRVNFVGADRPSGAFDVPRTCPELIRILTELDDDYLVVEPSPVENTKQLLDWAAAIPGATQIVSNETGTVLRLPSTIAAGGCPVS